MNFTKDDIFDDIKSIDFQGRLFVMTGTFTIGERSVVKKIILDKGGVVKSRMSSNTNYLLVGEVASNEWKYGNYGLKIEQALRYKEKDFIDLKIVHEQDFIKCLDKETPQENDYIDILKECFLQEEQNPIKPSSDIFVNDYGEVIEAQHYKTDDPLKDIWKILSNKNIIYFKQYIQFIRYLFEMLSDSQQEQYLNEIVIKIHSMILNAVYNSIEENIISAKKLKTRKGQINRLQKNYESTIDWVGCYKTKKIEKIIDKLLECKESIVLNSEPSAKKTTSP